MLGHVPFCESYSSTTINAFMRDGSVNLRKFIYGERIMLSRNLSYLMEFLYKFTSTRKLSFCSTYKFTGYKLSPSNLCSMYNCLLVLFLCHLLCSGVHLLCFFALWFCLLGLQFLVRPQFLLLSNVFFCKH